MPRSTIDAVGSKARCGSAVLISKERSTTSVAVGADGAVMAPDAATAATTSATAARAALAPSGYENGSWRPPAERGSAALEPIPSHAKVEAAWAARQVVRADRRRLAASRQRSCRPRARASPDPLPSTGRTRTDNADGSGRRREGEQDRAPLRAALRAGSRSRRDGARLRSAPRCRDAEAATRAIGLVPSRPSRRGT